MSEHRAQLRWKRTSADFTYDTYNRAHEMLFKDGAIVLPASSAPRISGAMQSASIPKKRSSPRCRAATC